MEVETVELLPIYDIITVFSSAASGYELGEEVLIVNPHVPASLSRVSNHSGNYWLSVKLVGMGSNRSAIGARVAVTSGGQRQSREVQSGSSCISQSNLHQHFGLGPAKKADQLEIQWPNGMLELAGSAEVDQFLTLREGSGIVKAERFR